ncbi:MAG: cell division protein FtsA [Bacteroidota bacterium]|nr:cell division protein FtsA [Candidatus Kapabacteria bacterium]MCS7302392.1 cell division protein FtsA [Candidatus Kapabacteria bacterium]MCX7937134.1 cell division protein FtsA [Chlorobiota bacterium]MDW8074627.1 cell division protein FtsA [Bacteroidota bacterium]MDW8270897.1 cell division protein FtsA [Bacteroidota bacterium]
MNNPQQRIARASRSPRHSNVIVGLDIGTTKVCAIVAAPDEKNAALTVLGIGVAENTGLARGIVVNIEKTVAAIEEAIAQAETTSGVEITDVVVGIAGDHVQSFQSRSAVAIAGSEREVRSSDLQRLMDDARRIAIPADRVILHLFPQDYILDGQDGIVDPLGMTGVRLEANIHVVTAARTALENIHRCVERAGLSVTEIVLQPVASSMAVLDSAEREVGVALVDIGGGTTDIAIFDEGVIRHTAMFAIAGNKVTDDIKKGLGIVHAQAEQIKIAYGHALQESILHDEVFMIPGINGRKPIEVSKSMLCQIIQPRMEEIFEFAFAEIRRSGYARNLAAGVVLTGGCAQLRGAAELAERIFGMPVKVGIPTIGLHGGFVPEVQSPMYATAVGLVLFAQELRTNAAYRTGMTYRHIERSQRSTLGYRNVLERIKHFFEHL